MAANRTGGPLSDSEAAPELFVGRNTELQQLRECAAGVRAGRSCTALVEAEPGMGKSALLRRFLTELNDFAVLRATCDPPETSKPHGTIGQLVSSAPPSALSASPLLIGTIPAGASPSEVGAQLVGVLGELQRTGPVAIVVDDLQWVDMPSLHALGFMQRRLWADRVFLLFAARTEAPALPGPAPDAVEWRRLVAGPDVAYTARLSGLDLAEVVQLAGLMAPGRLPAWTVERLHEYTGGHPLYVRTLLADPDSLGSTDETFAVPGSLQTTVRKVLAALTPASRELLSALAVLDGRFPLAVVAELAGVSDAAAALEPVLAAGLARWWPSEPSSPIELCHPLQRNEIYVVLSPIRRRQLHALAVPLVGSAAAWAHRVAATDHVDLELAAELEQAAAQALADGDVDRSATYLLWAAEITDSKTDRERRLLTAAAQLFFWQMHHRAETLREAASVCSPSPLRDLVLAHSAMAHGELAAAEHHLTEATHSTVVVPGADWVQARAASTLAALYVVKGRGSEAVQAGQRALDFGAVDPYGHITAKLYVAAGCFLHEGAYAALRQLDDYASLPSDPADAAPEDAVLLTWRGGWRTLAGELTAGAEDARVAIRLARAGAFNHIAEYAHFWLAHACYLLGDWERAALNADIAVVMARSEDKVWDYAAVHTIAAVIAASRGELAAAADHAGAVDEAVQTIGPQFAVYSAMAGASVAQVRFDYPGMMTALEPLLSRSGTDGWHRGYRPWWVPLQVEALIGMDELDDAAVALGELDELVSSMPYLSTLSAWLSGWHAVQCGDQQTARRAYETGLSRQLTGDDAPLHRVRLERAYGLLLAATHDRDGAAEWLHRAYTRSLDLGATPLANHCAADLIAHGLGRPDAGPQHLLALTDRERTVADLVARGLSNRETAVELYVTTKTVEYHLGNVYAKLGIRSRSQLRRLYARASDEAQPVLAGRKGTKSAALSWSGGPSPRDSGRQY